MDTESPKIFLSSSLTLYTDTENYMDIELHKKNFKPNIRIFAQNWIAKSILPSKVKPWFLNSIEVFLTETIFTFEREDNHILIDFHRHWQILNNLLLETYNQSMLQTILSIFKNEFYLNDELLNLYRYHFAVVHHSYFVPNVQKFFILYNQFIEQIVEFFEQINIYAIVRSIDNYVMKASNSLTREQFNFILIVRKRLNTLIKKIYTILKFYYVSDLENLAAAYADSGLIEIYQISTNEQVKFDTLPIHLAERNVICGESFFFFFSEESQATYIKEKLIQIAQTKFDLCMKAIFENEQRPDFPIVIHKFTWAQYMNGLCNVLISEKK